MSSYSVLPTASVSARDMFLQISRYGHWRDASQTRLLYWRDASHTTLDYCIGGMDLTIH